MLVREFLIKKIIWNNNLKRNKKTTMYTDIFIDLQKWMCIKSEIFSISSKKRKLLPVLIKIKNSD